MLIWILDSIHGNITPGQGFYKNLNLRSEMSKSSTQSRKKRIDILKTQILFESDPRVDRDPRLATGCYWADFGRIPIEAQAAGKTIIASDHGAVKDTIKNGNNFTGFKVKPNDPQALSIAIKQSITMDKKDLTKMHERAISNVKKNFSLENMCKKTLEVYKRLLISE